MTQQERHQKFFNTAYTAHVLEGKSLGFTVDKETDEVVGSYLLGDSIGVNLTLRERLSIEEFGLDTVEYNVQDLLDHKIPFITSYNEFDLPFLHQLEYSQMMACTYVLARPVTHLEGTKRISNGEIVGDRSRYEVLKFNYEVLANAWGFTIPE